MSSNFDGPGSLVTFTTYEKDREIVLQQTGYAPDCGIVGAVVNPVGARQVAWSIQAAKSQAALARRDSVVCVPD